MRHGATAEEQREAFADYLETRWDRLVPEHPLPGRHLVMRYLHRSRHYHHVGHLANVLACVDRLADVAADTRSVELAAWFHDAVYDVRARDNEEQSAQLAERELDAIGLEPDTIAEVARLVRLTVHHDPGDGDANGAVLCDADLAVLAGNADDYDAYAREIREEYAHVDDADFRAGRAAVLRQLLGLPSIFRTEPGLEWEAAARANLVRELAVLEDG